MFIMILIDTLLFYSWYNAKSNPTPLLQSVPHCAWLFYDTESTRMLQPSQHDTLAISWFNARPVSATSAQHKNNVLGSPSRVCWIGRSAASVNCTLKSGDDGSRSGGLLYCINIVDFLIQIGRIAFNIVCKKKLF